MRWWLPFALLLTGCASGPRFKDQPIVWRVDDDRNIEEPEENEYFALQYFPRVFATRRLTRTLEVHDGEPAHNTNALDEVPDSTWFQNRIGRFDITPGQAAIGPGGSAPELPMTVASGKTGGGNPGFVVKDAAGRKFLIKFDTRENPEMQTGGNVVVNRIFWTLGYNVPRDHVFVFGRGDVVLGKGATATNALGDKVLMTPRQLDEVLDAVPQQADDKFRATASELLEGIPKGGFEPEGVRDDDPNDTVPHEHRRDLRGLRVFAAWVSHTDMKLDNTLDMYVERDGRRFLVHYLLDFGEALGGHQAEKDRPEDGHEHYFDWKNQTKATFSFGLWKRPWEDTRNTPWPAIGAFSARGFDPAEWREAYPYWPFFEMDESDAYWAAKLVLRFDRAMLRAIVARAMLSEPDAAAYLVDALYERRERIGETYLEALSPFDALRIERGKLCGHDLGVYHRLRTHGVVQRLRGDDVVEERTVDKRGRACLSLPRDDAYAIYRLRIEAGGVHKPVMQVHLRGGKRPRILGIVRRER